MHYYIDGYNLMFRLKGSKLSFAEKRESIIEELRHKCSLLQLSVSLIFDAHNTTEDDLPHYLGDLELCYTTHGQTADEWILVRISTSKKPSQITVVTSDHRLGACVRHAGGHTVSVETFSSWLDKRTHRKEKFLKQKLQKKPTTSLSSINLPLAPPPAPPPAIDVPVLERPKMGDRWLDYYLEVFEERLAQLAKEGKKKKGDGA